MLPSARCSRVLFLCLAVVTGACGPGAAADDAGPTDADAATLPADAGGSGDAASCVAIDCGGDELCFDGVDNDCDGTVDEDCVCAAGSTARCLPPGSDPGLAICAWGEMTCGGDVEFGSWSACVPPAGPGGEGSLYGCRRIGIMGAPGANPSSNFQTWLETQGAIATRFHGTAAAATLQLAELETFDLVIVDWLQRSYTAEEAATLAGWVRAGGALMALTGHDSGATADRHVSLLAELGPNYDLPSGPLSGPATLVAHPTTLTVDGTATLPPVTFNGGLRVLVPAAQSATIVPMAVIGDAVVGVAGPLGDGRVLLFGDEWIEFDSEWSTVPAIPQFWLNTVTWSSPDVGVPICE